MSEPDLPIGAAPEALTTVTIPAVEEAKASFERVHRYREAFARLAKHDPDIARMLEGGYGRNLAIALKIVESKLRSL